MKAGPIWIDKLCSCRNERALLQKLLGLPRAHRGAVLVPVFVGLALEPAAELHQNRGLENRGVRVFAHPGVLHVREGHAPLGFPEEIGPPPRLSRIHI